MRTDNSVFRPCAVIGGGLTGLIAALSLAHGGVPTFLVAKRSAEIDNRTTALLAGSVAALEALGVWEACRAHAAPLRMMRIADDTGRLWRAPEVRFEAAEIGHEAFGWNIENRHLVAALWDRVATEPGISHVGAGATSVHLEPFGATIEMSDGPRLRAQLVVGADGRRSLCRAAAGIDMDERSYPQIALTYVLKHSRQHHNISTEFHTNSGPFTIVPLPGLRSSLVCVVAPAEAERLATLSREALDLEIERRCHSMLGKIEVESGRGAFPLVVATAARAASGRIALVGEAAHVVPPIGAQGLNLSLRDAVTIAELAIEAHRADRDIGADAVTADYERRRRPDIASRTAAIDLLNRSLLSDFLPIQGLRGLGLYALDRIGPLRRAVMREGIAPSAAMPRLMQGGARPARPADVRS